MKNKVINLSLSLFAILFTLVFSECVAQLYVQKIALHAKLFEPDTLLGWRVKANLNIKRKNSNGEVWTIQTDVNGFRKLPKQGEGTPKIIILGDSYAFGEGVNVEDRFDSAIDFRNYTVINLGVMGYGTDQQLLKAEPYLERLQKGDFVLLLTSFNDFYDILRKVHSGRAKPWYEYEEDQLVLHKPFIGLKEIIRDKSYIYMKLSSFFARHEKVIQADVKPACILYEKLIEELAQKLSAKGVNLILAYHGIPFIKDSIPQKKIEGTLTTVCKNNSITCINIDQTFTRSTHPDCYLTDGHWNKMGHKKVNLLLQKLIPGQ